MKTKPRANRKKPYGPNIVRAWFDTVFLYALRGLENEREVLVHRNWTFRYHNQRLEYLGPLAEHLPAEAKPNLEQFVSFFPGAGSRISVHDDRQHRLEQDCIAYYEAILKDANFRKVFEHVASDAPETLGGDFSSHFGAVGEAGFEPVLAEYLVNNIEKLPGYYKPAALWNHYSRRFFEAISTPELASFRKTTEQSGQALQEAVDYLAAFLKSTRSKLSLEFDVPYVTEVSSLR